MLGLSLPIDIPWKRLAVSSDLIAKPTIGPRRRWRSSLAIFGYEPPAEEQTYDGMTVSYVKVVATITGFQPDPDDVGLRDRRAYQAFADSTVTKYYEDVASKYYGCYGAILEVSVVPKGTSEEVNKIPLIDYPYFVDFEPKKRELYEIVSETGEMMSRSLETVNVRKGATTSDSHEVLDIFGGAQASASASNGGQSASGSLGFSGQWGTRDMSQEGYENVRTTDSGREARETFSHTTQLTQMYHQLDSYHLGTNRAVFYVLPRPHVVQTEKTFVNGPRVLEGIQEFLLVVMRPKSVANVCVEARIETAHLASEPQLAHETGTGQLNLHMQLKAPVPSNTAPIRDDSITIVSSPQTETFLPPEGWEVDLDFAGTRTGPGYRVDFQEDTGLKSLVFNSQREQVSVTGVIEAKFVDLFVNQFIDGRLDVAATVFTRRKSPTVTGYTQALWLTGHSISTCNNDDANSQRDYITFETSIDTSTQQPVGSGAMTLVEANKLRADIIDKVRDSMNHPSRYLPGTVRFPEANFISKTISKIIRRPGHDDNIALANLPNLDATIKTQISKVSATVTRGQLLSMEPQEIADRFNLTTDQAARLRRTALGLEGPAPSGSIKWNRRLTVVKQVKREDETGSAPAAPERKRKTRRAK
jgi:hypothetical protein